jgi:cellulose synthase/poly-beta-1,6-N-acetylglucosamine synthase-like glycosyltransferase
MLIAALILSIALLVLVLREHRAVRARARTAPPPLAPSDTAHTLPVTALVPARNEAAVIGDALRSLRAQTCPPERVIVIDDGSTDETVARALEAAPEATVIRLHDLPPGWTGKTHALARGCERAESPWVLTLDADVCLAPDALARAHAAAVAESLDALSLSPDQVAPSGAVRAIQEAAYAMLDRLYPFSHTSRGGAREAAASGAFMLLRRSALDAAGGFGAVNGELVEDLALARRLAERGSRVSFRPARGLVRVRMYDTMHAAFEGWRRLLAALVASSRRSPGIRGEIVYHAVVGSALPVAGAIAAIVATASIPIAAAIAACVGGTTLILGGPQAAVRWSVGRLLLCAALVSSSAACRSRAGVRWKDRTYSAPAS